MRWKSKNFIRSLQSLIKSWDTAAVTLYKEYDKIQIHDQVSLTDLQTDAILAYIKPANTAHKSQTDVLLKI